MGESTDFQYCVSRKHFTISRHQRREEKRREQVHRFQIPRLVPEIQELPIFKNVWSQRSCGAHHIGWSNKTHSSKICLDA